jgi:hypothetical protein
LARKISPAKAAEFQAKYLEKLRKVELVEQAYGTGNVEGAVISGCWGKLAGDTPWASLLVKIQGKRYPVEFKLTEEEASEWAKMEEKIEAMRTKMVAKIQKRVGVPAPKDYKPLYRRR